VGVVAVDPSSPFTGGSILGDRIRMQAHVSDSGVFVRSMSSRGHLGGLADATSRVLVVLAAAGFDPIIVETVGVGQSEVEVVGTADTTVVVVTPGWGDGVQAAKAGVLEIGDVFVVNKADLPGADGVARDLVQMLELAPSAEWDVPVVRCAAADGSGVQDVWDAVARHQDFLRGDGRLGAVRRARAEAELRRAVTARLARRVAAAALDPAIVDAVADRRIDPWSAAASVAVG
jgi:LAO/AO transport system kinase